MMEVLRRQRIADATDGRWHDRHDGVSRLSEEERRVLARVAAHLLRMLGVIAADAVNVADRKTAGAAGDRHGGNRPDWRSCVHGIPSKLLSFTEVHDNAS